MFNTKWKKTLYTSESKNIQFQVKRDRDKIERLLDRALQSKPIYTSNPALNQQVMTQLAFIFAQRRFGCINQPAFIGKVSVAKDSSQILQPISVTASDSAIQTSGRTLCLSRTDRCHSECDTGTLGVPRGRPVANALKRST